MSQTDFDKFENELRRKIKGDVAFDDVTLGIYATDAGIYQIRPVAVVLPRDEEDVKNAVVSAAKYRVNILPRGSGTSLGGQAVGYAMILDFTKYMNRILELNLAKRWVRVQPGIILDVLNAELAKYDLQFAPDPATSSRATIGGMIGNNSSGARSVYYGITKDHVLEAKVLLSDGTEMWFREFFILDDPAGWSTREREIVRRFKKIIAANCDEIKKQFPKQMRRVQGYNLDAFADTVRWNLAKLIVGSEGTLATVLDAKLNLVPLPKHKALCAVHFNDLLAGIRAVEAILTHRPSAVEILDHEIVARAGKNLSIAPLCNFVRGEPQAILVVEFFGDTQKEAEEKAETLAENLQNRKKGYAWPVIVAAEEQAKVWAVRKNGLGLMLGIKGDRKPLGFIEDASIPVEHLPDYIDKILSFCREKNVPVVMYAHASVGTIHIRPALSMKSGQDINTMQEIAEFSFNLVLKYHGSVSSEHGDGRNRSPFLKRYFGGQIYQALRDVKQLFDPAGLMNPGVIVDANPMDQDLRFGPNYQTPVVDTLYHYREEGDFAHAVELCNGVGVCRQELDGTMCPSYRATRDEVDSTRGRANALRLAMTGQLDTDGLSSEKLYGVLDLCLSCKSCKAECPSNVDLARLKSEVLQKYHDEHGVALRDKLAAKSTAMAAVIAGWKAAVVVNFVQGNFLFRRLMEWIAGIDKRRRLPRYAKKSFLKWFEERKRTRPESAKKIVLFDDTYMNFHEPHIGFSAVELLESCGYEVILAGAGCCQRPKISHGFLREAKGKGEKTLRNLDRYIQHGLQIVVCEPGCASALTDDLPDLIDDEKLGDRIKANVKMIDVFLAEEIKNGNLQTQFISPFEKIIIHGHCHQKSLFGTIRMKEILELVPGISVSEIDSGCCGMAGSFGYEKEHFELSLIIGEDRLFPAIRNREEGTAVVACGFSCRHQIKDGTGVQAVHWVETLRGKF